MFEITEDAALDPLPSRMGSPYGSLLRQGWQGRTWRPWWWPMVVLG